MSMPRLEKLEEFKTALADYHISDASKKVLAGTELVLLAGPTSGGRNTIIRELLKTGQYHFIVSDTTRPPRYNDGVLEQNGVEYWFRNEDEMLNDIRRGNFLEAELIHGQQVSGISIRELKAASNEHKIAINEVDLGGVHAVTKAKPSTITIVILPPSFELWQKRLKGRGQMHDDELKRRLQTAVRIFADAAAHDYFKLVINDNLQHAAQQVHKLATAGPADAEQQRRNRELAKQLCDQTKHYLKNFS